MSIFFCSTVVRGQQLGRTIGFPTANLSIDSTAELPAKGVYAARVKVMGEEYRAMAYIGGRPTVDSSAQKVIEVNILDFEADLYGQTLELELVEFVRGEQRFDSLDSLREQILRDKDRIEAILK